MSLTSDLAQEAMSLPDVVMVVLTRKGVVLPLSGRLHDCSVPELVLLEQFAQRRAPVGDAIDATARQTGCDRERLEAFVEVLRQDALLRPSQTHGDAKALAEEVYTATPATFEVDDQVVLPTPVILGLGRSGFEEHDHDGKARVRLNARELMATAAFRQPGSCDEVFVKHQGDAGSGALERDAFDRLVARLLAVGLLRKFDDDDLGFRHSYSRNDEIVRREVRGRRTVGAAMKRSMARLDKEEAERRARTGVARTKVFPVHAIKSAWRNPPLSLGMIMAYAMAYDDAVLREHYDFRPDWMINEEKVDAHAGEPAIYLFSNYVWSSAQNLALSAYVKEKSPASVTIHGGPDVPKYEGDVAEYFAAHPHVDITSRGEGEVTTAEVLARLIGHVGDGPVDLSVLRDVPGISYRDRDGTIVRTPDRERLADLDVIPSPYLTGLFDAYAEGWRKLAEFGGTGADAWAYQLPVAVLETNRGCPYGCTFCDWGSATLSRIRQFSLERVYAELEWCAANKVDTVGLADANFGIFARDVEITEKVARLKKDVGYPNQFGTNYAKNTVKHLQKIVETLTDADILSYGLLSLQSMDADTLLTIKRSNIKLEKYEDLAKEFQRAGLPLYVDLMLGLPGQTVRALANDLQECIDREVHAKVFPTQLLVNSPMNEPSYRERHGIVAKPGQLVTESATFTRDEYDRMMKIRQVFYVLEKFGVLRHVARYVRHETGMREVDVFEKMLDTVNEAPREWPVLRFTFDQLSRYMVPPVSWKLLLDEVREYLVKEVSLVDDDALHTVLTVQHMVLPSRDRTFPQTRELPHDYAAWYASVLTTKYEGHLNDWPTVAPPLRSFGPGTFSVDDPRGVCIHELGRPADENPWDAWDLKSEVSRPVVFQNY